MNGRRFSLSLSSSFPSPIVLGLTRNTNLSQSLVRIVRHDDVHIDTFTMIIHLTKRTSVCLWRSRDEPLCPVYIPNVRVRVTSWNLYELRSPAEEREFQVRRWACESPSEPNFVYEIYLHLFQRRTSSIRNPHHKVCPYRPLPVAVWQMPEHFEESNRGVERSIDEDWRWSHFEIERISIGTQFA